LPNKTVLEGELLFVDEHYDIALLEISSESDLPLQIPSFGSNPNYGQEVFVLARDLDLYLIARSGRIEWLEKSDYLGHNCHMFLSCEFPSVRIILLSSHRVLASLLDYSIILLHAGGHWRTGN
jgi:hypothetical protein